MSTGMDVDELQHALGGVVLESAFLERVLRAAFSALIDSKYAAVTLLVTSAKAGEGKSTAALNLAATCARPASGPCSWTSISVAPV